jgi:hypothetical protein
MSEPEVKPQEPEVQPPTQAEPPEETVGDIMKKSGDEGVKFWLIIISALVYLSGIVYAEVHGLNQLRNGVAADLRMWATLGIVAAGVTAVILPLVLKYWTFESKQRIAAFMFYLLDFGFLAFNSFTDFNINNGAALLPWAQAYVSYVLPASPIIVAACWSIVWMLDPDVQQKILAGTLRAAMKQKLAHKVADAAKGANVTARVSAAAEREVERALTELFGAQVTGYVMNADELPARRGLLSSFFGSLYSWAQRGLSSTMPTQSQPPESDKTNPPQA